MKSNVEIIFYKNSRFVFWSEADLTSHLMIEYDMKNRCVSNNDEAYFSIRFNNDYQDRISISLS